MSEVHGEIVYTTPNKKARVERQFQDGVVYYGVFVQTDEVPENYSHHRTYSGPNGLSFAKDWANYKANPY